MEYGFTRTQEAGEEPEHVSRGSELHLARELQSEDYIGELYESFWPQEGACEIPVPKWSDQGDVFFLVSHLKNRLKILKIQILKSLNFENSNS